LYRAGNLRNPKELVLFKVRAPGHGEHPDRSIVNAKINPS